MSYLYMENWDSQSVFGETMENPEFSFDPWSFQLEEDDLMNFPEIFQPNNIINNPNVLDDQFEQQLYTPFYPDQLNMNPFSMPVLEVHHVAEEEEDEEPAEINRKHQQSVSVSAKPKRSSRKNQQNRVVRHVTADDLQSDTWAWRKYGQKPIKGSPYPRSYYRCSSLKGCLARKQVERSCSDPKIFIITYTAEHSHGHPTRRNSLSGSTRNKSSSSTSVTKRLADKNEPRVMRIEEDESAKQESMRMEELHRIEDVDEKDKVLCDELIHSFEGFEGLLEDQFPDFSHELWSMDESLQF